MDKRSATLDLAGHRERQIAVAADHNKICKFTSAEDDTYELVSSNLVWLVNGAVAAQRKGQSNPSSLDPSNGRGPNIDCKFVFRVRFKALELIY